MGVLPRPYYWWEAGAMWGAMLDYWSSTGDSSYNAVAYEALLSQVAPNYDFMMPNRFGEMGNDDQAFWGFTTMTAAEYDWQAPPSPVPSWLQLTVNLWNSQAQRWDLETCNGGLKWQVFSRNSGYNYKNSVSNMAFFQLSARLAAHTGNSTYLEWAEKSWDWSARIGLVSSRYEVFDGSDDLLNCTEIDHTRYSYTAGMAMYGAAVLYNYTKGSSIWQDRVSGLLGASSVFFSPFDNSTNVMVESACETVATCNNDMLSFKAYLGRFMWATMKLAPFTGETIYKLLSTSAVAAAQACSGGATGEECGSKWYVGGCDGMFGPGQQLGALEVIQGLLTHPRPPPSTTSTSSTAVSTEPTTPPSSTVPSSTVPSATVTKPAVTKPAVTSPAGTSSTVTDPAPTAEKKSIGARSAMLDTNFVLISAAGVLLASLWSSL
jgi:mannan endo-1,6-alpha-mannosidase